MTTLVLTVVGADRSGLVAEVAHVVSDHDGNWETSRLAELAGTFAGVIEVSVAPERAEALSEALAGVDGLLTVAVPADRSSGAANLPARRFAFQVLGNDHPGIVREITATLGGQGVSIERMTTQTVDAAMAGGRLFEATIEAVVPASVELSVLVTMIEQLATELRVDVTLLEGTGAADAPMLGL